MKSTWRSLQRNGFIKSTGEKREDGPCYFLTRFGWRTGLKIAGKLDDPEFEKKLVKIITAAKRHVKGRHDDDVIETDVLAGEADVSGEFLYNVVESELIQIKYGKQDLKWETPNKNYIRIPLDFYM